MNPFKKMWDPNNIKRNTIIQIVIVTLAFIMLIRLWPFNLVKKHIYSEQQAISQNTDLQGEALTFADKKLQTVSFTNQHINRIKLYMSCTEWEATDKILFRLYDENFSCIYEEEYSCSKIAEDNYLNAVMDMDVDTDKAYYYEVIVPEDVTASLSVPTADNSRLSQSENGTLYIDGIINTDISLIADFEYTQDLSIFVKIGYTILILAVTLLIYAAVLWLLDVTDAYLADAVKYIKWAISAVTAIIAVFIFVETVVWNVFSGEAGDRVVYALGILAGVFWIMCVIWMPREIRKPSKLPVNRQVSFIWRNYIQTVCFGFLFYALCLYVNADREYYHQTNTRWMLIFLGIVFLMIHSEKTWKNIPCYIWTGVSILGSIIYCYNFTEQQEIYLARLTAAVVVVWGLVVITALMQIKCESWHTISKPFFGIWLLFAVLMMINRFQKMWPFTATLPFAVLLLYNLSAAQKNRLLKNFTNGIIFSFVLVMLFSFLHRPYHFWMRYRYNMIFHTVACTGMYLSTVFAAIIGKLYGKWKSGETALNKCWKELFFLSAVIAFTLFSMSRTAMLTIFTCFCLVTIMSAYIYKKRIKRIAQEIGVIALACIVSFPLAFTAVRMLPALADDPIRYDLEPQDSSYMIYEGDPIDSGKYMTIERYFRLLFNRLDISQASADTLQEESQYLLAYIGNERLPVAVTEERNYVLENDSDISNGRLEIFMIYLKELNFVGHETMAPENVDNGHAHNSYIQVAYDFGIIAGVVFLVLCAYTLIKSVLLCVKQGRKYSYFMIPFSMVINFGMMSVSEWAFHPCIPTGFCFLFVQMLLMQKESDKKESIS